MSAVLAGLHFVAFAMRVAPKVAAFLALGEPATGDLMLVTAMNMHTQAILESDNSRGATIDRTIIYGTTSGGTTIDADEYGGNPFATALIQISREHDQTLAALLPELRALTRTGSGGHQTPSWVLQPHDGTWSFPMAEGSRAERRVALVLVVSDYTSPGATPLAGAAYDERRVAAMLASHGFTVVQGIHPDRQSLLKALRSFARNSRNADVALVYCTGHGVEQAHQVHLLPANYPFDSGFRSTTLNRSGIPVQRIATACRATKVNLTFFAGCRTTV